MNHFHDAVEPPNMALKMLYRGPSSRLETLIEKIQQNKDSSPGMNQLYTLITLKIIHINLTEAGIDRAYFVD